MISSAAAQPPTHAMPSMIQHNKQHTEQQGLAQQSNFTACHTVSCIAATLNIISTHMPNKQCAAQPTQTCHTSSCLHTLTMSCVVTVSPSAWKTGTPMKLLVGTPASLYSCANTVQARSQQQHNGCKRRHQHSTGRLCTLMPLTHRTDYRLRMRSRNRNAFSCMLPEGAGMHVQVAFGRPPWRTCSACLTCCISGMNLKWMPCSPVVSRGVVNTSYTLSSVTRSTLLSRASRGFSSLICGRNAVPAGRQKGNGPC